MAIEPTISGMEALHVNKNDNMFRLPFPSLPTSFRSRSSFSFLKASGYGISQPVFQIRRASKDAGIVLPNLQTIAPSKPCSSTSAKQLRDQSTGIENIAGNIHPLHRSFDKPNACLNFEHSFLAFYDKNCASNVSESRSSNSVFHLGEHTLGVCCNASEASYFLDENFESSVCPQGVCLNQHMNHGSSQPQCARQQGCFDTDLVCTHFRSETSRLPHALECGIAANPSCAQTVCLNAQLGSRPLPSSRTSPARTTPGPSRAHTSCPASAHTKGNPSLPHTKNACTQGACQNATMKNSLFFNYTKCIKTTDPPINLHDEIKCTRIAPHVTVLPENKSDFEHHEPFFHATQNAFFNSDLNAQIMFFTNGLWQCTLLLNFGVLHELDM